MWFECKCGKKINDISDFQYNKAHVIPDKIWDGFWTDIDNSVEKSGPSQKEKEAACMALRKNRYSRLMYQCADCGRIYINDKSNELHIYKPETEETSKVILDAT